MRCWTAPVAKQCCACKEDMRPITSKSSETSSTMSVAKLRQNAREPTGPPRTRVPERVTSIGRGNPSARTSASDNDGEKHLLLESFI